MPEGEEAGSFPPFKVFETRRFLADRAGLGSLERKRLESKLRDYVYPILRQTPRYGPNIKRLRN